MRELYNRKNERLDIRKYVVKDILVSRVSSLP
jgi:hypothetical protein